MDVFRRQVTRFGTRFIGGAVTECVSQASVELVADDKVIKGRVGNHSQPARQLTPGIESESV